jgi:hypothetical protein
MAQVFVCPSCNKAVKVTGVPVEQCPHCGATLPPGLRRTVEESFVPRRPFMLTFQAYFGFFCGAILCLAIPSAFAPVDDEMLRQALDMLGFADMPLPPHLPPLAAGLLTIAEAFLLLYSSMALIKNDPRSRPLLIWLIFVLTVPETVILAPSLAGSDLGRAFFLGNCVVALLSLSLSYLYLYKWKHPVRYYESLHYIQSLRSDSEES